MSHFNMSGDVLKQKFGVIHKVLRILLIGYSMPRLRKSGFIGNNFKAKLIVIMAFMIIILTSLYIYKTYSFYEVTNSYNIIKGRIGNFTTGDLKVSIYLEDSVNSNTYSSSSLDLFPREYDGYEYKETICDNNATITPVWDSENYKLTVNGELTGKAKCSVYFDRIAVYTVTLSVNGATSSTSTITGYSGTSTTEATMTPNTNYVYSRAVCNSGTGSYNSATKKFKVTGLTGNGTCTVNFVNRAILATWLNNSIPVSDTPLASTAFASVETSQVGVYPTTDDYGTSYYVRGASNYNYVKFGTVGGVPIWWRIIRINGDGTVRMIYLGTGESVPATTGASTAISSYTYVFNSSYNNNAYVGYMYTSGSRQGLGKSSYAKSELESWYDTNLTAYKDYIADRIFCGDRTSSTSPSATWTNPMTSSGGTSTTATYYGAYLRLYNTSKTPTLVCPEEPDKYTVENATENASTGHGNGALKYPIGLITADEVAFAGGTYGSSNSGYYLYTGQYYWTMSPYNFYGSSARVWRVGSDGSLYGIDVDAQHGRRAVINLRSDVTVTGSGTSTSPFEIATS